MASDPRFTCWRDAVAALVTIPATSDNALGLPLSPVVADDPEYTYPQFLADVLDGITA